MVPKIVRLAPNTEPELFFIEPTGSVGPRLNSKTIDIKDIAAGETAVALCPAQAFPVPKFR